MATATSKFSLGKIGTGRMLLIAAAALLFAALSWLMLNFADLKGNARLGSSYMAHVTCSCRYIQGRSLTDCAKDGEAGTEIVRISDDPANKRVTASVPFLATAMAQHRGQFGCQQLNDAEMDAL